MSTPQQPELHRSKQTPEMDLDNVASDLNTHPTPADKDHGKRPTPPGNQPGHHPNKEQDKPDLDEFAKKLGVDAEASKVRREHDGPIGKALADVRHRLPDYDTAALADRIRGAAPDIDVDGSVRLTRRVSAKALAVAATGLHKAAARVEELAEQLEGEELQDSDAG